MGSILTGLLFTHPSGYSVLKPFRLAGVGTEVPVIVKNAIDDAILGVDAVWFSYSSNRLRSIALWTLGGIFIYRYLNKIDEAIMF